MTRQTKILLVRVTSVIGIVAAIAAILFIQVSRNFRTILNLTDDQARFMLNNELPKGTNKFRVKQFLDARKWPYSDNAAMVQTMIHDAAHNALILKGTQTQFYFHCETQLI